MALPAFAQDDRSFFYRGKNLHVARGGPHVVAFVTVGIAKRLTVSFDPGPHRVPGYGYYTFTLADHEDMAHRQVPQADWEQAPDPQDAALMIYMDLERELALNRWVQHELGDHIQAAGMFVKVMSRHNIGSEVNANGRKRGEAESGEPDEEGG